MKEQTTDSSAGTRVIDKINERVAEGSTPMFSFEYFPPKTEKGRENLFSRLARMSTLNPTWVDVTWGAGGTTSDATMDICTTAQNKIGLETMMHLTCTNMPVEKFVEALDKAKASGIRNILALRGDPPRGEQWREIEGGFAHAVDLVKYIRKHYGDYFGIAVAGYPEGHTEAENYQQDLQHLKEKVDAGADLIITQLFYDCDLFLKFHQDCRDLGITVPIVPGIMPIQTYGGFQRMTTLCKTFVPQPIKDALEPIKSNDEMVKKYGVSLAISMCRKLVNAGIPCLHFYTLNLEKSVMQILEGLGLIDGLVVDRPLPWRLMTKRENEEVRPIFWANRPESYVYRTASWDEFPNGRWGDSRSPAFGELTSHHYTSVHAPLVTTDDSFVYGDELKSEQDVFDVFVKYCKGEIPGLPWFDRQLAPESSDIQQQLIKLNENGFLTINSQPRVNGVPSTHPVYGWGTAGGYVYQKAYAEFFCSPEKFQLLRKELESHPSLTYHALKKNSEALTNADRNDVAAVTWGVFPGQEIKQPTVVDPESFGVWKDEAFELWNTTWAAHYDAGSASSSILNSMIENYWLVNLYDNDFMQGDIFAPFNAIIDAKLP